MKTKDKFFALLKEGFTLKTLRKMNESQLNVLYKKVVKEQIDTQLSSANEKAEELKQKVQGIQQAIGEEDEELEEDNVDNIKPFKGQQTQNPKQVGPSSDDGMDNYQDGMDVFEDKKKSSKMKTPITTLGMFEDEIKEKFESKAQQGYFFARCEEEGPKSKWCKMAREFASDTKDFSKLPEKKESKEDEIRQIEESIVSLIKNYNKPTMTKKDLLEQGTKEAPVKTPTKTPSKPERKNPYKPKHRPAPKASDTETAPTRTKPGTKEKPGKSTPYQPKHRPAPKAGDTQEIPSFLKFDNLNITFRDE